MTKDAFKERERALEEEFFYRMDKQLLAKLKQELATGKERERLAATTGITDDALLIELVQQGVSAEAVTAMSLVPLVLVAWSDGKMDTEERPLIVACARQQGISEGSVGDQLLDHWLATKPGPQLISTWKHYLQAASEKMTDAGRATLQKDILNRARAVAKSAGGPLGFGRISADEKRVLAEIEAAFGD